jgi:hypothetical protein
MNTEFLDKIDEADPKYAIDKLVPGSDAAKDIWQKCICIYQTLAKFWAPRIEVGRCCQRYLRRDIFSAEQREKYELQDKWPIEPQELKPVINAAAGQIGQTVRSSAITMEDDEPPANAARPDVMNVVIKWLQTRMHLESKSKKGLREGLVTGYPQWLWFERARAAEGYAGDLSATLRPWDSTLCSPLFYEGLEIDCVVNLFNKTKTEMLENFPNRKEKYEEHVKLLGNPEYINGIIGMGDSITADSRKTLFYDNISAAKYDAIQGFLFVIERVFCLHTKRKVWINQKTADVVVLPPDWKGWQEDVWHQLNPDYDLSKTQDVKTLWVSTIDQSGFVWENAEHWFQCDGKLPGIVYIPSMDDNIPSGIAEDLLPYILAVAACKTEGLSQVRKGSGFLTVYKENSFLEPNTVGVELSKEDGVVAVKKHANIDQDITFKDRKPNDTYYQLSDRMREEMREVHNINLSIMGTSNPRQSDKAKQREIIQGMISQAPYIENYTYFNLNTTQLLCDMIPYFLNEYKVIEIQDEFGKKLGPVEVNVQEFDARGEEAKIVANDLTSAKYRVVPVLSDDSATNREKEYDDFVRMIEATGNQMLQSDPVFIANIWKHLPNRFAKEAAEGLVKYGQQREQAAARAGQAQQQVEAQKEASKQAVEMEKIKRPNWNIRLSPTDFNEAPEGFKLMMNTLAALNMGQQPTAPMPQEAAPAMV